MNMLIYSIALSAISFPFVREAHTLLIDMRLHSSDRDFLKWCLENGPILSVILQSHWFQLSWDSTEIELV